MTPACLSDLQRGAVAVGFGLLLAHAAVATCPPPEEQSLSDVHCPRSTHATQEALDLCYMKVGCAINGPWPLATRALVAAIVPRSQSCPLKSFVCMGAEQ